MQQQQQAVIKVNELDSTTDLERARRCVRRVRSVHADIAGEVQGMETVLGFDEPGADLDDPGAGQVPDGDDGERVGVRWRLWCWQGGR